MNKYYVYAHIRKDNGDIFYVGKGSGDRLIQKKGRNNYWKNIVTKYGYQQIKLIENLTEKESFQKEIEYIAHYKSKGMCKANISFGGDGVKVEKRWWGEAISKAQKGKIKPKGILSKSYKNLVSIDELKKLYIDENKNSVEIAKILNVSITTVCSRLKEFNLSTRTAGRKKIPIVCVNDGNVFSSIMDAARFYGVYRENIRKVLRGDYKHTNKLVFKYETTK
jgi:hypothetical protein